MIERCASCGEVCEDPVCEPVLFGYDGAGMPVFLPTPKCLDCWEKKRLAWEEKWRELGKLWHQTQAAPEDAPDPGEEP